MQASSHDAAGTPDESDLEAALRRTPDAARRAVRVSPGDLRRLRVLYVAARPDAPYRYRCVHACEQLRASGVAANVIGIDDPRLLESVTAYSTVILFRLPWSERVARVVDRARASGASIAFEVDDLVFDPAVEPLMPFLARLPPAERAEYHALFSGLARTLPEVDYCIASTDTIARHLQACGKPVVVHPNLLSESHVELGRVIAPLRPALVREPLVAYLSGSPTHDGDLASIGGAIAAALGANPALSLILVGPVRPPSEVAPYAPRVLRVPYVDSRVYPWLMARCRAVLAPIEAVNDFSNAKSALKVFEGGIFGVPVIASPTVAYRESIDPGRTGLLASTPAGWIESIGTLTDRVASLRMGQASRRRTLARYTQSAWRNVLAHELLQRDGHATGTRPRLAPLRIGTEDVALPRRVRHELGVIRSTARFVLRTPRPGAGAEVVAAPQALLQSLATAPRRGRTLLVEGEPSGVVLVDREHPLADARPDPETVVFSRGRGARSALHATHADPRFRVEVEEVPRGPLTVVLRMRARPAAGRATAQLFWTPDASGTFVEERSVRIPLEGDDAWHVYSAPLPASASREGTCRFRFDPLDAPGEAEVALVALLTPRDIPAAPDVRTALTARFGTSGSPERPGPASVPPGETLEGAGAALARAAVGESILLTAGWEGTSAEAFERAVWRVADEAGAHVLELLEDATPLRVAVLRRPRAGDPRRPVDIVVPVYNAREYTRRCVESVLRHATGDWRLVLVDDASPDPGISPDLEEFARTNPRVLVRRNERNLGFVATANRGMREAAGRDVLLLNSDTEVFEGFLDRLRAAATADPRTGILTPFSNNATICSIPDFPRDNPIPEGYTPEQWAGLVAASSERSRPELPTGVGFCLYLRADVLARVGLFDEETFGRGYGEENDLCQRARKAGFRVALCDDVFVYHKGKASFGSEGWDLQDNVNARRLEAKHPGYHAEIARFVESNPLAPLHDRIRFHLPRLRPGAEHAILFLLHGSPWGDRPGGTEFHVLDLLRALALPRAVVAWPEPAGVGAAEVLAGDVGAPLLRSFPAGASPAPFAMGAALRRAIELLGVRAVHVHHLLRWPHDIAQTLEDAGVPHVWTHHDYFAVCLNWNLYDYERNEPCGCRTDPARTSRCLAACARATGALSGGNLDAIAREHRAGMDRAIASARAHVFPSTAARSVFERQLGDVGVPRHVIPHGYDVRATAERPPPGARLRVALVGEVAYPLKGAERYLDLLSRTSALDIEWHVFGDVERFGYSKRLGALPLGDRLVLHGAYPRDSLPDLLVRHGIDLCAILPNWDETFSYVLSEALVAGIPAIVSDRGALAERMRADGAGVVVGTVEEAAAELASVVRHRARLATWTERARSYRHRPVAASAEEHRALYASLGWLDDAPLRASDSPALVAIHALAAAGTAPTPSFQRGPLRRLARAAVPESARIALSSLLARAFPTLWKRTPAAWSGSGGRAAR